MTRMPLKTQKQPNILPSQVLGYISPYPTVVMVATAHQHAAGILEKLLESSGAILPSSFISQKYRILGVERGVSETSDRPTGGQEEKRE